MPEVPYQLSALAREGQAVVRKIMASATRAKLLHDQWKLFFSSPFSPLTEPRRESATGRGRQDCFFQKGLWSRPGADLVAAGRRSGRDRAQIWSRPGVDLVATGRISEYCRGRQKMRSLHKFSAGIPTVKVRIFGQYACQQMQGLCGSPGTLA